MHPLHTLPKNLNTENQQTISWKVTQGGQFYLALHRDFIKRVKLSEISVIVSSY